MDETKLYLPFAKVDKKKRMVFGLVSSESVDAHGEVVKKGAIERAFPDYMKFGNIREMHQPSAVGKVKEFSHKDEGTWIGAKIVDNVAWTKVLEGVYGGFSIGGTVTKKRGNVIEELRLSEISVVDRPANPDAVFELIKFDNNKHNLVEKFDNKVEIGKSVIGLILDGQVDLPNLIKGENNKMTLKKDEIKDPLEETTEEEVVEETTEETTEEKPEETKEETTEEKPEETEETEETDETDETEESEKVEKGRKKKEVVEPTEPTEPVEPVEPTDEPVEPTDEPEEPVVEPTTADIRGDDEPTVVTEHVGGEAPVTVPTEVHKAILAKGVQEVTALASVVDHLGFITSRFEQNKRKSTPKLKKALAELLGAIQAEANLNDEAKKVEKSDSSEVGQLTKMVTDLTEKVDSLLSKGDRSKAPKATLVKKGIDIPSETTEESSGDLAKANEELASITKEIDEWHQGMLTNQNNPVETQKLLDKQAGLFQKFNDAKQKIAELS